MVDDEREQFAKLIASTWKVYNKTIDVDVLDQFWFDLLDCSLQQIAHALSMHRRSSAHPPRPADLLKIINPKTVKNNHGLQTCIEEGCDELQWGIHHARCKNHTAEFYANEYFKDVSLAKELGT